MEIEAIAPASTGVKTTEPVKVSNDINPELMDASHAKVVTEGAVVAADESGKTKDQDKEKKNGQNGKKKHEASESSVDDAVRSANRRMERTRCEYSYHKETNRVSIKVIDKDTDKVIREIPPEKSLDMLQKMWEMAGIMVDERR